MALFVNAPLVKFRKKFDYVINGSTTCFWAMYLVLYRQIMGVSRGRWYRRSPSFFEPRAYFEIWIITECFSKFTTVSNLGKFALCILISYWFRAQNFPGATPPDPHCCSLRSLFAACGIWLLAGTSLRLLASRLPLSKILDTPLRQIPYKWLFQSDPFVVSAPGTLFLKHE